MKPKMKPIIVVIVSLLLLSSVFLIGKATGVFMPTPTPTATATATATFTPSPTSTSTNTPTSTSTSTPLPTNTPTVTMTPTITNTPRPTATNKLYAVPSPEGLTCEVEPQWNNPAPGHEIGYGCFAVSCYMDGKFYYGNNATCLTPWPYDWDFYYYSREDLVK